MDFEFTQDNIVSAVAGVGAVNVGLAEFADLNLLTEIFGSDPTLGALAIAASGGLMLTEKFGLTEVLDS